MKIIDISRVVQQAPIYPGCPATQMVRENTISGGDESNFTLISTHSHAGTHCDAFSHFVDGATPIDRMDLHLYYGSCLVFTAPGDSVLSRADLEGRLEGTERLVLHGGGTAVLDETAAQYLIDSGVRLLVTDGTGVSKPEENQKIHVQLLGNGVAIVENVILDGVTDGEYTLCCFPVKYGDCDGGPCRAVLIKAD